MKFINPEHQIDFEAHEMIQKYDYDKAYEQAMSYVRSYRDDINNMLVFNKDKFLLWSDKIMFWTQIALRIKKLKDEYNGRTKG